MTAPVLEMHRKTPGPAHEREFGGTPDQVGKARAWLRETARREGISVPEDAYLALGELGANALQHTASGQPGGRFAVGAREHPDGVLVWVRDQGGRLADKRAAGEHGRGLEIVTEIATGFGVGTGPHSPVERVPDGRGPLAAGGCFWCVIPAERERSHDAPPARLPEQEQSLPQRTRGRSR